ncbi:MAG: hypothetical protein RIC55_12000 [Pirellulaceae bacterium]
MTFSRYPTAQLAAVVVVLTGVFISAVSPGRATGAEPTNTRAIERGQRIVSAGHSFHMFVPALLARMAADADIEGHQQTARQSIGGSYVHQHWNRADDQNVVKQSLKTGEVDVLTLSPIYLPDDGIENFTRLALETNPDIRITLQEFWLPFDVYAPDYKKSRPQPVDRNSRTAADLREIYAPYFASMDEHVRELNKKFDKQVLYVVPAGQATILLREKILAGEAPGLEQQNDLFRDAIGHGTPPLQALVAYCHYAVIYRRSPEGLPIPAILDAKTYGEHAEALNRLLQQLAWQAAREHPLSGVK